MGRNINYLLPTNKTNLVLLNELRNSNSCSDNDVILQTIFRVQRVSIDRATQVLRNRFINSSSLHGKSFPIDSVLIKPVSDLCNLNCVYCYEGKGHQRVSDKMTISTLKKSLEEILKNVRGKLSISWHGGEPLLRGIDFYESAMSFQKEFNINNVDVTNTIQTNAMLLSPQWAAFFLENNFKVGISLDGDSDLNDIVRFDFRGKGIYKKVANSIKMLTSHNIYPSLISVIGKQHLGKSKGYFESLLTLGIQSFDAHPSFGFDGTNSSNNIDSESYCDFMFELFELWIDNNDPNVRIRPFDEFFKAYIGERSGICMHNGGCSKIFALNANGDVIPCTRPFHGDEYIFGNIVEDSLGDIIEGEKWNRFVMNEKTGQDLSISCKWRNICFGGCPQHRYENGSQDITKANYFCSCQNEKGIGLGLLWERMLEKIDKHLEYVKNSRDLQK